MKYKYADKDHKFVTTGISTILVNRSRRWKEVQDWIDAGNEIEPFETPEEIAVREKMDRELLRDQLMNQSPVILSNPLSNWWTPGMDTGMRSCRLASGQTWRTLFQD